MPIIAPISYKIEIKKAVVEALRLILLNLPDRYDVINDDLFISLTYPELPEQYPAIIVDYSEKKLETMGIAHLEYENDGAEVRQRFYYHGTITLTVYATKSLMRDYISDMLVYLLAFSQTDPYTASFIPYLNTNPDIDMQPAINTIYPNGESVQSGVSWGVADARIYTVSYSFDVHGTIASPVVNYPYIRGINVDAEIDP